MYFNLVGILGVGVGCSFFVLVFVISVLELGV